MPIELNVVGIRTVHGKVPSNSWAIRRNDDADPPLWLYATADRLLIVAMLTQVGPWLAVVNL
jgi:hypothetical protein